MSAQRYPFFIRIVHWLMAIVIIGIGILGIYMAPFESRPEEVSEGLYFWHKSFGMLMLFLIVARIVQRLRVRLPELPESLAPWERTAGAISHVVMYVLMLLVPVFGYVHSSSFEKGHGINFFFVDLPQLVANDAFIAELFRDLHKWSGYLLLAVVAVHAAGAVKHRFFDSNKSNDVFPRVL